MKRKYYNYFVHSKKRTALVVGCLSQTKTASQSRPRIYGGNYRLADAYMQPRTHTAYNEGPAVYIRQS